MSTLLPVTQRAPELSSTVWKRYRAFLRQPPELNVSWCDPETGARAYLIINSLRGGAAGGGTRMRLGCDPREVTYLAKAMELKFALCGPPIGGAKTGIDFDPHDPRKTKVLEKWYRTIAPLLHDCYGTGGDLNIDEVLDVVPAFERVGLTHPQEGVVRGHLRPDAAGLQSVMHRLDEGVAADVAADPFGIDGVRLSVADMITGYGVAMALKRFYEQQGRSLEGVRVLLEGFGNVGAACGLYLTRYGARLVAIRDAEKTLVDPLGVDADDAADLYRRRNNKLLPREDARIREASAFWSVEADAFVCAAISESVTPQLLEVMSERGVSVIACGANQPFRESKIGSTRVAQTADRRFSVLADIAANAGMARAFSYLMEPDAQAVAAPVFHAVERTITENVDQVITRANSDKGLLAATFGLALDRIGAP